MRFTKKKAYKKRAKHYHEKERQLEKLKELAMNKAPDLEYNHKMAKLQMKDGKAVEKKTHV